MLAGLDVGYLTMYVCVCVWAGVYGWVGGYVYVYVWAYLSRRGYVCVSTGLGRWVGVCV